MKQKEKRDSTSSKILNTTFTLLSQRGYANVSLRDISSDAGVALSQISYYFKSKEGLFIAVIDNTIEEYLYELKKALESGTTREEKLNHLIAFTKELVTKNTSTMKLLMDFNAQSLWIPSFKEHINKMFTEITSIIEENILNNYDQKNKKESKNFSAKEFARFIFGSLYGTSMQAILDNKNDDILTSINLGEQLFSI